MPYEPSGPKVLLVEGEDPKRLLPHVARYLGVGEPEIWNFGGVERLGPEIRALAKSTGFRNVKSLGIIRDAEGSAKNAFASVVGAVTSAGLTPPRRIGEPGSGTPKVSILILPDDENSGMLESVLLQSVEGQPAMRCVEALFECVRDTGDPLPRNMNKARVSAYLATRVEGGKQKHIGESAGSKVWPFDHAAFQPLCRFLTSI